MFLVQVGCPRERQPFFFSSPAFQPSWRPVLAGTRFENSGLFKGNYRFYFRSARQFEFLIERKEVSSCGWVLGNCTIGYVISILDEGDVSKSFLRVFIFYRLDVLYYHMHKEFTRNNLNLS